jgi:hypothetical protein
MQFNIEFTPGPSLNAADPMPRTRDQAIASPFTENKR